MLGRKYNHIMDILRDHKQSLGIAIQNFPEGAIISMPLRAEGESKKKAFLGGVLSGIVELSEQY